MIDKDKIQYIKGIGWKLITVKTIEKCSKCNKELGRPFFFCWELGLSYCVKCEFEGGNSTCRSIEQEHTHYNIFELEIIEEEKIS